MMNAFATHCREKLDMQNITASNRHIRCFLHVLNLSAQQLLTNISTNREMVASATTRGHVPRDAVAKVCIKLISKIANWLYFQIYFQLREIVKKIRSSPQQTARFTKICSVEGLDSLKLIMDVKIRWNSTYDMIEQAYKLRSVIDSSRLYLG